MATSAAVYGDKVNERAAEVMRTEYNLEDSLMKFIGFQLEHASALRVEGRFLVSKNSCQPFGVLHGGVSALIAESLASFGAYIASNHVAVAGVQLSINHLRAAPIGTEVFVSAEPVQTGKRIQVWDVSFFEVVDSTRSVSETNTEVNKKLAVSRVTIMAGLTGKKMEHSDQELNIHAHDNPEMST